MASTFLVDNDFLRNMIAAGGEANPGAALESFYNYATAQGAAIAITDVVEGESVNDLSYANDRAVSKWLEAHDVAVSVDRSDVLVAA